MRIDRFEDVVSLSTCWPTSKVNERKVTLNGEL